MADNSLGSATAILFDLDGVLVDSTECVERSWRNWAARHGLDPDRVLEVAHGRRTMETIPLVAPHLVVADEVASLEGAESHTTEGVYEVPGARALLERLPVDAWAIVTSGVRSVATLRIRHTHLPMPRVLVCADEITRGKPHPEGYLTAADRLGKKPAECMVIEDTPAGLEAARAAGMSSIGIAGTYPATALGTADLVVPRLSALPVELIDRVISRGASPPDRLRR
jgi:mannitol-1-/sugar-/sorbitol-6-phosphatase